MRPVLAALQPRDSVAAGRTAAVLGIVAAGVTLLLGVANASAEEATSTEVAITAAVAVAMVVVAWSARGLDATNRRTWAVAPLAGIAMIVGLDLYSQDSSTAAQVFLLFPALFAASQLRRPGVMIVVAATIAAECIVTFALQPWQDAVIDAGYLSSVIVTTAVLLTVAEEQRERLFAQLERQASIDPLTGLVTRRILDDAARLALSDAATSTGTALVLIDVDNFKNINDTYGHPGGDEILIQLAAALMRLARPTDVVSRLGGDEIALLMPGCSEGALTHRTRQLLADLQAHVYELDDGRVVEVSVSGGVAHAPTDAADLRALYAAADGALYQAKGRGRNQFHAASVALSPPR